MFPLFLRLTLFFSPLGSFLYVSFGLFSHHLVGFLKLFDHPVTTSHPLCLLLRFSSRLLQITFKNEVGQYDLEVTTFQLAVLFAWNQRPRERISFENLKLATELPDAELRRTLWVRDI